MLGFEQVSRLLRKPKYVCKCLRNCYEGRQNYIGWQFDPDNDWDELSSLVDVQKGRIHRYLDDEESLKYRILPKVSLAASLPLRYILGSPGLIRFRLQIPGITQEAAGGRFTYSERFMRRVDLVCHLDPGWASSSGSNCYPLRQEEAPQRGDSPPMYAHGFVFVISAHRADAEESVDFHGSVSLCHRYTPSLPPPSLFPQYGLTDILILYLSRYAAFLVAFLSMGNSM